MFSELKFFKYISKILIYNGKVKLFDIETICETIWIYKIWIKKKPLISNYFILTLKD